MFVWELSSASLVAEISVSSPRKLFVFIILKTIFWIKVSRKIFYFILKKEALELSLFPLVQVRAIIGAACECQKAGVKVHPDIMVPLIATVAELKHQDKLIRDEAAKTMAKHGVTVAFRVGTMIEVPRAALLAGEIAEVCFLLYIAQLKCFMMCLY